MLIRTRAPRRPERPRLRTPPSPPLSQATLLPPRTLQPHLLIRASPRLPSRRLRPPRSSPHAAATNPLWAASARVWEGRHLDPAHVQRTRSTPTPATRTTRRSCRAPSAHQSPRRARTSRVTLAPTVLGRVVFLPRFFSIAALLPPRARPTNLGLPPPCLVRRRRTPSSLRLCLHRHHLRRLNPQALRLLRTLRRRHGRARRCRGRQPPSCCRSRSSARSRTATSRTSRRTASSTT